MALSLSRKREGLQPAADPNMIPFIDVLLVLLVIFMVTAPKPTTDIKVGIPPPDSRAPYSPIEPTFVMLRATATGFAIFVGNDPVTMDQLGQRTLAHILGADPYLTPATAYSHARVYVQADLDVAYGNVVSVVDELKESQFETVSIVAQDASAP